MQKSWQSPLLCTLVIVIWGSLYISGRLVLQQIPALLVLFIRYALSSGILLGVGHHTLLIGAGCIEAAMVLNSLAARKATTSLTERQ